MSESGDPRLTNEDLAPTKAAQRVWTRWDIAALWVGMVICIPTYGLAAGLVAQGVALPIALATIILGNVVVLLPMVLNGHAGTRYGIPFPVLLRASFGVFGANIPAMLRAITACGWFGIQTWIGGKAIYLLAVVLAPSVELPVFLPDWFGLTTGQLVAFLVFWAINVAIIIRGMESLRLLEKASAPVLLAMGIALFVWAWSKVGFSAMLETPAPPPGVEAPPISTALGVGLTSAVAFWGTLALNIPDFARFARSQRDQVVGQAIGLPPTMAFFVFIGAAVTNATFVIFGTRIADPTEVVARIGGVPLLIIAMFGLAIATLSTNLAANIVSPANDLSNLAPRHISFKRGAVIAATAGALIMPWKLWESSATYVSTWLLGYGAMLGSVGGIMIVDYWVLRRCELVVDELYRRGGRYEYSRGFNPIAIVALVAGIALNVPGFLGALGVITPPAFFTRIYEWGWFVAFGTAGTVYYAGTKLLRR